LIFAETIFKKAIFANIMLGFPRTRLGDPCYCREISAFETLFVKEELAGWLIRHKLYDQREKVNTPAKNGLKTAWRLTAKGFKVTASQLHP